jgi:hypothetical protein
MHDILQNEHIPAPLRRSAGRIKKRLYIGISRDRHTCGTKNQNYCLAIEFVAAIKGVVT